MADPSGPTGRLAEAFAYAAELHAHQKRKGKETPYLGHLLGVTSLVIKSGGDEDQIIAALLHDAVEDQGGAPVLEEIRRRFGEQVASIVDACSDTDQSPKPPWRKRKEAYLGKLEDAPLEVLRVSAADKLDNAREILSDLRAGGPSVWERFSAPLEEQLWYYDSLVDVFKRRFPGELTHELERVVGELRRIATE